MHHKIVIDIFYVPRTQCLSYVFTWIWK